MTFQLTLGTGNTHTKVLSEPSPRVVRIRLYPASQAPDVQGLGGISIANNVINI